MDSPLPIWQSSLLAHGCQVETGCAVLPQKLEPVGDRVICTPTVSGAMMPFAVRVAVGHAVTITWDQELSRYIIEAHGEKIAA